MNKRNIFIIALYEFKCARRNIFFGIFTILSLVGLVIYQFTPTEVNSVHDVFRFSMEWISQVFPASLAYKTAYFFNLFQLFFIVGFVVVDSNINRLGVIETLHVRPFGNTEIVIGNFLGKLFLFTLVNLIVFVVSILLNVSFFSRSFDLSVYFFYWITLILPTSVYFLGFCYLVTRFVRHPGISMLLLPAFSGIIIYDGAGWLNGLLDPCARSIPNMFSDFTGHVNLENYLLQRGFTLSVGIGFLVLSVLPYPRVPNHLLAFRRISGIACGIFIVTCGLGFAYQARHGIVHDNREAYKQVYEELGKFPAAKVVRNDLRVKELGNGNISVVSEMTVTNRNSVKIPLIIYLNPGLKVTSFEIDGETVFYRRDHQALITGKELNLRETCKVLIRYEGGIENDLCFLDTPPGAYTCPTVNGIGIYRFGYSPAFCGKKYKLLTPECIWYPVCVPPYGESGIRVVNFSRYSLRVEHDPRLMAISQGDRIEKEKGETEFAFAHDMPGISLCVGDYNERTVLLDSTRVSFYFHPAHEYLLEEYDIIPEDTLPKRLLRKKENLENEECIQTSEFIKKYYIEKYYYKRGQDVSDPTQQYPYRWGILVEVPVDFYCFPHVMQRTGERVQGGIVFLPEKAYSIKAYPFKVPNVIEEEEKVDYISNIRLANDIETFIGKGGCSIRPMLQGKTISIISREYPILQDVLSDISRKNRGTVSWTYPAEDCVAVEYLSRNSLKDALQDKSLLPEALENIIRKKNNELQTYISLFVDRERFRRFYHNFLASNLFKETTAEECFSQFYRTFGIRLDSLIESWYNSARLPLLDIRDTRAIKITGTEKAYWLYCFKVFNRSDVPGLVEIDNDQKWVIPPRAGREIRTRVLINPMQSVFSMSTPLARNLPAMILLEPEEASYLSVDTTTGVFNVDSSVFLPAAGENEIIVDNEDAGFRVVKTENLITSLFRKEKSGKKYYDHVTGEDIWLPTIKEHFYGFPVRSALYKEVSEGKQKVEWSVRLPEAGKYEVFFYYTAFAGGGRKSIPDWIEFSSLSEKKKQETSRFYTVFDGRKEHKVVVAPGEDDLGCWVSLGIFDFTENARVTLSDKKMNEGYSQGLVADAVKWVKVKE
ncbi:hypothetical protein [Gabonibacter massiliensis]|uniref:hypothetical protein n=1 Tax=Gabonibacter massiliensis TaxID=1720195 RepID=UPI00073E263A|nr:hypothetical protein [Gabonibacter massiliensis]